MSQNLLRNYQINIRIMPLPGKIQSFVVYKDDFYTIVVNECLNQNARMRAYRHELDHIENGDFESDLPTGMIEIRAHKKEDTPCPDLTYPLISDE